MKLVQITLISVNTVALFLPFRTLAGINALPGSYV